MKKESFAFLLLMGSMVVLLGLFTLRHLHPEKIIDETRTVFIKKTDKGFQLFRNGRPFHILGASGNEHFKELSDVGGNTIRLYDTLNISHILDEAQKANLAVIIDIPIPKYNREFDFYLNEDNKRVLKQKISSLVKKSKNHPALLMWNLGNELFYPFVFYKNSFINTFNEIIDIIHSEDPNHPVCTAIAGYSRLETASIYLHSPKIDLLAYNLFGGIKKDLENKMPEISFLFGARPFYISEFGSDGGWESKLTSWGAPIEQTSTKKIEQIRTRYNIIKELKTDACLGSLIFYWGNKHQVTYTWYSLFKEDHTSEIIKELENLWQVKQGNPIQIGLDYMVVDGKGAADNIIFAPNELKISELIFQNSRINSHRIEWEIFPDMWYELWYMDVHKMRLKPKKLEGCFVGFDKNKATFITPTIEGPYRIFAYVYDSHGYFATTNTPFYVLNPK